MKSGEIWLVNFSPSVGDEIGKTRPAVVVGNDRIAGLDLRIVVPIIGRTAEARPWHIRIRPGSINSLVKESLVDCFQVKSVSRQRFGKRLGSISATELDAIKVCIAEVLDLL
jgi:mRNA interferase MazF